MLHFTLNRGRRAGQYLPLLLCQEHFAQLAPEVQALYVGCVQQLLGTGACRSVRQDDCDRCSA